MHNRQPPYTESPGITTRPWRRQLAAGIATMTLSGALATQAIAETYLDAMILHTPGLSER